MRIVLERTLEILNGTMTIPIPYQSLSESWFHYLSIIVIFIMTILMVRYFRHASDDKLRLILLTFSLVLIGLELYKQLLISYNHQWTYQWRHFPYHMCSTPMYVALLAGIIKKGNLQNVLISYLATFSLLAGAYVALVDPSQVFRISIGLNIQTMIHHGAMIVLGVTLLIHSMSIVRQHFKGSVLVYFTLFILAVAMNYLHNVFIDTHQVFNVFYINPVHEINTHLLVGIQRSVPHMLFLMIIFIGYTLISYIFLVVITMLVPSILRKFK